MAYWIIIFYNCAAHFKEIYLPSTQVYLERKFSHLKFTLQVNSTQKRSDLSDATIFKKTNRIAYVLINDFLTIRL